MKASALPLLLLSNLDDGAVKPSLRNPSARARAPPAVVGGMPDREMGPLSLSPFPHFPFSRPFLILCCFGSPVGRALRTRTSSLSSLSSSHHIPTPSVALFSPHSMPLCRYEHFQYCVAFAVRCGLSGNWLDYAPTHP